MHHKHSVSTRDRLIDVTIEALWRQNCVATGVGQLCQAADIQKGSFYHYFKSKSELVIAAIQVAWERVKCEMYDPVFANKPHSLSQFHDFVGQVLALQQQCLKSHGQVLGCPFGNLGHEMAVHDKEIRQALAEIFDAQVDIFEKALDGIAETGEISLGDNRMRAMNLISFIEGTLMMARIYNDPNIVQQATSTIDSLAKS